MAKTKEELREARKQWFAPMEQKLKEIHTQEDEGTGGRVPVSQKCKTRILNS